MLIIYYDSKTGNVERFVKKIRKEIIKCEIIKISEDLIITERGHLITYTTKRGQIPETTAKFLTNNSHLIKSISSSGNTNWGSAYGAAADLISQFYNIKLLIKFELSGQNSDVEKFISKTL